MKRIVSRITYHPLGKCQRKSNHSHLVELYAILNQFYARDCARRTLPVYEAAIGKQGAIEAEVRKPDLIILDLCLPDMDGVEVVKSVRTWSSVSIMILWAHSHEQHKIDALDAGADDYLTKPFSFGELLARIRVALRYSANVGVTTNPEIFTSGEWGAVERHHRSTTEPEG